MSGGISSAKPGWLAVERRGLKPVEGPALASSQAAAARGRRGNSRRTCPYISESAAGPGCSVRRRGRARCSCSAPSRSADSIAFGSSAIAWRRPQSVGRIAAVHWLCVIERSLRARHELRMKIGDLALRRPAKIVLFELFALQIGDLQEVVQVARSWCGGSSAEARRRACPSSRRRSSGRSPRGRLARDACARS